MRASSVGRVLLAQAAAIGGVALVLLGLWLWSRGSILGHELRRPTWGTAAARSAAIAAVAAGQWAFWAVVVPAYFREGRLEHIARWTAAGVLVVAVAVAGVTGTYAAGLIG